MRPLHIGVLVVGAALAGGLAVKMTQAPVFQAAIVKPAPIVRPAPVPTPSPVETPPPVVSAAPPPVYMEDKPVPKVAQKPSPVKPVRVDPVPIRKPAPIQISRVMPAPAPRRAEMKQLESAAPVAAPVPYQAPPAPITQNQPDQPIAPSEVLRIPENPPPPMPLNPVPLQVTLRQGTQIAVRLDQEISSDHLIAGDTFQASLAEPLVVDGYVIAERGARISGKVVDSKNAGRLTGTSAIQLALSSFHSSDGQKVAISTEPWVKQGESARNQDLAKIGGGAALGAIIGAIAGGGKGAAIGAGAGGAAGTGAAAATGGKPVRIPSETVIRFKLASGVSVTERPL